MQKEATVKAQQQIEEQRLKEEQEESHKGQSGSDVMPTHEPESVTFD